MWFFQCFDFRSMTLDNFQEDKRTTGSFFMTRSPHSKFALEIYGFLGTTWKRFAEPRDSVDHYLRSAARKLPRWYSWLHWSILTPFMWVVRHGSPCGVLEGRYKPNSQVFNSKNFQRFPPLFLNLELADRISRDWSYELTEVFPIIIQIFIANVRYDRNYKRADWHLIFPE